MENMTIEQMKEQLTRLEQNIAYYGKEIARYTEKPSRYTDIASTAKWLKESVDEHRKLTKELKQAEKDAKEQAKAGKEQAKLTFLKNIKGTEVLDDYLNEIYQKDIAWWESLKEASRKELGKVEKVFASMTREHAEKVFQQDLECRRYDILRRVSEKVGDITKLDVKRNENLGLDGFVTGTKGTAHLTTIGVGGYNIVRFHFRTLVQ